MNQKHRGYVIFFIPLNQTKLIEEPLVVFVCATTGQGDEPDNMKVSSVLWLCYYKEIFCGYC